MECVAVALGKMEQNQQSGRAFDERADRAVLFSANDQVAFPIACFGAVLGQEWALVDRQHALRNRRMLQPSLETTPVDPLNFRAASTMMLQLADP